MNVEAPKLNDAVNQTEVSKKLSPESKKGIEEKTTEIKKKPSIANAVKNELNIPVEKETKKLRDLIDLGKESNESIEYKKTKLNIFKESGSITAFELGKRINDKALIISEEKGYLSPEDYKNAKSEIINSLSNEELEEILIDRKNSLTDEVIEKLKENPKIKLMADKIENPEVFMDMIAIYGIGEIEQYSELFDKINVDKVPNSVEEMDSLMEENSEVLVGKDATVESIKLDIDKYKEIIKKNPEDKIALGIIEFLLKLFHINLDYNSFGGKLPKGLDKMPASVEKLLKIAMSQVGVNEMDGSADKYLQEIGYKGRKSAGNENAWCAAFVNWTLMKSGMDYNSSLASQSFINGTGKGHVGFKVGNQLLGGNQSDRVSLKTLNLSKVQGWVMPDNRGDIHRRGDSTFDQNKIPDGAILVFSSSKNTR